MNRPGNPVITESLPNRMLGSFFHGSVSQWSSSSNHRLRTVEDESPCDES